jgi:DNA-binding NarL/FixJ family response regulator
MNPVIRVIIVDDHEIFRVGLRLIINKLGYAKVVGEAADGIEFLELIEQEETDLVLMDIQMPNMNGAEATKKALEKFPNLKIIALSVYTDDEHIRMMMEAGVKGFLIKNIRKEVLDRALQAVYIGKTYYSEELWDYFTKAVVRETKQEEHIYFTPRELDVLRLLAEGLNSKQIGDRLFVSERTVVGHKSNLMAKSGSKNTVGLLTYALHNNLITI